MIEEHPLEWLAPLLNGVEHANFFEQRATEYSKGATKGDWQSVWTSFDSRRKARGANDGSGDAVDAAIIDAANEPDMFSGNSVAAE
jgi:ribonucleoside-diphosphate reductase beta chain